MTVLLNILLREEIQHIPTELRSEDNLFYYISPLISYLIIVYVMKNIHPRNLNELIE